MSRSSVSGLTVVDTEITFIGKQLLIRVVPLRHSKSFKMSHLAEVNIRTFETETNNYILYTIQTYLFQFWNKGSLSTRDLLCVQMLKVVWQDQFNCHKKSEVLKQLPERLIEIK